MLRSCAPALLRSTETTLELLAGKQDHKTQLHPMFPAGEIAANLVFGVP
jgi:hypothetical protein